MMSDINFNIIESPQRFFKDHDYTVVLSSSDYFVPYMAVAIASIIKHSENRHNYDIIILERDISELNRKRIVSAIDGRPNFSIRFFNVQKVMERLNFYMPDRRLSAETYFGLLLPWILRNHERAICMDCDMVLCTDIARAYDFDWNRYCAGVVRDVIWQGFLADESTGMSEYARNVLKVKNPYDCFNGGFINLNLGKIRREIDPSRVVKLINEYQFRTVDQDIFNIILEGKVYYLQEGWCHLVPSTRKIREYISLAKDEPLYRAANKSPHLLHFAGENKPWFNPDIEFGEKFWEIAKNTLYYEIILARMIAHSVKGARAYSFNNDDMGCDSNEESRSLIRKIADLIMPKGSLLRRCVKRVLPSKGTPLWNKLRHIYHCIMGPNKA